MSTSTTSRLLPHLISLVILAAMVLAYFAPQLQGKEVQQTDVTQYHGMSKEIQEVYEKEKRVIRWSNTMFGGMPTYQINAVRDGNMLTGVGQVMQLGIKGPIGLFLIAAFGFYLMAVLMRIHPYISLAGAIAFALTTNNLVLWEAGHITKVEALVYMPIMAAGMMLAFRRKPLLGGALFALGTGLSLTASHVQMTYYFFLTAIIFGVAQLVYAIRTKTWGEFIKGAAALVIGGGLAAGAVASNLLPTYEYQKETMRGGSILKEVKISETQSGGEEDGLSWDYAMAWSNNSADLLSSFIPMAVGGSSSQRVSPGSPLLSDPNWVSVLNQYFNGKAPLYWGALPFTSGPIYFGALMCFFFVLGLLLVKGPIKWWLALGVLLTLLLSMGKNLAWFNELFYYNFPLYNKFRTPNSVLSIAAFLIPALAVLGLQQFFSKELSVAEKQKNLLIAGAISIGGLLLLLLAGLGSFSFTTENDSQFTQGGLSIQPLIDARKAAFRSDGFRSLGLMVLGFGMLWASLKGWLKPVLAIGVIAAFTLIDQWGVGRRNLSPDDFKPEIPVADRFPMREADKSIFASEKKDRGAYRVFDLSVDPFASTVASYYHSSIGGYHAAKLQRYQDMIDIHFRPSISRLQNRLKAGNATLDTLSNMLAGEQALRMLNAKYIILSADQPALRNPHALGNAWLVNSFNMVNTPDKEIQAVLNTDVAKTAVIHTEFASAVKGLSPSGQGSIRLTSYQPEHLKYAYEGVGEQFAVFSETWYGPNKGWKVFVDGKETDLVRVNYILRGVRLPAGNHTVEMKFDPKIYHTGVSISLISSGLVLASLLTVIGLLFWRRRKEEEELGVEPVTLYAGEQTPNKGFTSARDPKPVTKTKTVSKTPPPAKKKGK